MNKRSCDRCILQVKMKAVNTSNDLRLKSVLNFFLPSSSVFYIKQPLHQRAPATNGLKHQNPTEAPSALSSLNSSNSCFTIAM